MTIETRLAEMLCTRLCHDLTGPIGAIANGAEFLAEDQFELQGQAVELINQSAEQAVNRLQFYRSAYGRVNHNGEASLSDCKELISRFFTGTKITLDWPDGYTEAANISVSRKLARLMFNLVVIVAGTLIRGGVVSIRLRRDDNEKHVIISASGSTIKWDSEQEQALERRIDIDEVGPSTVQGYYTKVLAEELGVSFTFNRGEETFEIVAIQHEPELMG